jgi:RNA polymerase-binding transcription factor DksA
MNISELEKRLRAKERELWADMTRTEQEARAMSPGEGQNGAASAEVKENIFDETTLEWNTFAQVRDALQRIAKGTFGQCVDCGCQIEDHRLDSVPWTAYCLVHENRHERQMAERPL